MLARSPLPQRASDLRSLFPTALAGLAFAVVATAILALPLPTARHQTLSPARQVTQEVAAAAGTVAETGPATRQEAAPAQGLSSGQETAPPIALAGAESWDPVSRANVEQALNLLPASVQASLGNPVLGPVTVLVNSEGRTSSGRQPYGGAANFFSTSEGVNEVVLYPQQSVLTVLHELGHAYNLRQAAAGDYASVLLDPEMQSFLAITGWRVLTPPSELALMRDHSQASFDYAGALVWPSMSRNDPLEDFANSFAMYFFDPAALKSRSPERFAWFAARFEAHSALGN